MSDIDKCSEESNILYMCDKLADWIDKDISRSEWLTIKFKYCPFCGEIIKHEEYHNE